MSIKDVVHSNQSGTFWQVEIPGISAGSDFMNVVLKRSQCFWKGHNFSSATKRR
jgi:hypothetical protein